MPFSEAILRQAWIIAGGQCKCRRNSHNHSYRVCNKPLVWDNRGREGRGAWEAHHINSNGEDILSNCEILCWECHKNTRSFGRS